MPADTMDGYWEWFRKDGVIMRSGYFAMGKQTGEWTTYDKEDKVYKVTRMKEEQWIASGQLFPRLIVIYFLQWTDIAIVHPASILLPPSHCNLNNELVIGRNVL